MLAETQSHGEFLIAQARMIGWKVCGEIALVVAGPPTDGTLEQPFANTVFRAAAHPANVSQQGRHMNDIAEPSGQRRIAQSFNRFHKHKLAEGVLSAPFLPSFAKDRKT